MWVGSFQSKTDHFLISLATPCFLLLAGETSSYFSFSSYFSYFHGSLNSLTSAKTIGWLHYVGMFGLLHRANKNL